VSTTKSNEPKFYIGKDHIVRLRDRVDFSTTKKITDYPDLLDVQNKSYSDFLQDNLTPADRRNIGLQLAFKNNFPIEDSSGVFLFG